MLWTVLLFLALTTFLAYRRSSSLIWTAAIGVFLAAVTVLSPSTFMIWIAWPAFAVFAMLLNLAFIRKAVFTRFIFNPFRKALPRMSRTEREALEAGTVWWDGDLFSGMPDWEKLLKHNTAKLTDKEQAFLDGPVDELCSMLDDWEISQERNDLPPKVWQFIKDNKFFGMIIRKNMVVLGFQHLPIPR